MALAGVLGGVDQQDVRPEREHVGHGRDRQVLGLQVEQERAEGGEHLVGAPVREQHVKGHGIAPGYRVGISTGTLDLR